MSTRLPGGQRNAFLMITRDWLFRNLVQQGGRRRFTELEALLDLEWNARWGNRDLSLDEIDYAAPEGQVAASIRGFAARWNWSESVVRSFLKRRERLGHLSTRVVGRGRSRRTILRPHVSPSPLPGSSTREARLPAGCWPPLAQRGHNGGDNNGQPWRTVPPDTGTIEATPTLEMGTGEEDAFQGGRCGDGAGGKRKQ